jgi:hypothetical protein
MPPAVAVVAGAVTKAVAAAGIMKSVAVAGTALSVAGAVTKNPKLVKIGAIAGGIGTLGTLGAFGAGAKTWGMSEAAKGAALSTSTAAAAAPGYRATLAPGAGVRAIGQGAGELTAQSGLLAKATALPAAVAPPPSPTGFLAKAGTALKTGADLVKGNPELAAVLAQGGLELSNYLSGKTSAEIADLKANINLKDANAKQALQAIEMEERRRQNLNQGYLQVNPALSMPGFQNPYQPPGLLAGGLKQ